MKKFYAFAALALAAMSMSAQTTVTIAGGFNDWNATANPLEETSAGVYETTIPQLDTDFKIVVTEGEASQWLGSNEKLVLGTPLFIENIEGGGNINYADGGTVKDAKVKYALATSMLTITGEAGTIEIAYAFHGQFLSLDWTSYNMIKGADGKWSYTFDGMTVLDPNGQFGIKEINADNGNQLNWYAAPVDGVVISDEMQEIELTTVDTKNMGLQLTGSWTFTFYFDGDAPLLDVVKSAGINDIAAEIAEGEAEYFNLQGVRVAEPAAGLYLVRKAGKVSKVLVK